MANILAYMPYGDHCIPGQYHNNVGKLLLRETAVGAILKSSVHGPVVTGHVS